MRATEDFNPFHFLQGIGIRDGMTENTHLHWLAVEEHENIGVGSAAQAADGYLPGGAGADTVVEDTPLIDENAGNSSRNELVDVGGARFLDFIPIDDGKA
jgi:hypothetical protein